MEKILEACLEQLRAERQSPRYRRTLTIELPEGLSHDQLGEIDDALQQTVEMKLALFQAQEQPSNGKSYSPRFKSEEVAQSEEY